MSNKSHDETNNDTKIKRYSLDSDNAQEIFNKDSSSCSSMNDESIKIVHYQNFDKIPSDLMGEEFNNYIINYDIYKPPEQFKCLLEYYTDHIGIYDRNKQYYIFPADRLIILLALFFGDDKIANKISLDITVRDNILDDIGCCFKQVAQEDDKIIIKKIIIGDVILNYSHNGILYNRLENLYQICLTEVYSIKSSDTISYT